MSHLSMRVLSAWTLLGSIGKVAVTSENKWWCPWVGWESFLFFGKQEKKQKTKQCIPNVITAQEPELISPVCQPTDRPLYLGLRGGGVCGFLGSGKHHHNPRTWSSGKAAGKGLVPDRTSMPTAGDHIWLKCTILLLAFTFLLHEGYCRANKSLTWMHRWACNVLFLIVRPERQTRQTDNRTHGLLTGLYILAGAANDMAILFLLFSHILYKVSFSLNLQLSL